MIVTISHNHKCIPLGRAHMMKGRDWWVGKLIEKLPEFPLETHCLHMKTELKDVTFLCNEADFIQLQALSMIVTGIITDRYLEGQMAAAKKRIPKRNHK